MPNKTLELNIFIDAFGWELFKENQWFLKGVIMVKKPLRTVFGYSSACAPSIIAGEMPFKHGYWSSFYYSPKTSPFKMLKYLTFLPGAISNSARVRRHLSKIIKKLYGFTGYFQIYNVPFKYLAYFDYQEKYDIYAKDGIKGYKTIFDKLVEQKIPYSIAKGHDDNEKFERLNEILMKGEIEFAYLYLGELDNLLHLNKKNSNVVKDKLKGYDYQILKIYKNAKGNYGEVNLTVFSDHGMKEVSSSYDLIKDIKTLGLIYGRDYVAFYDATMARFWFLNDSSRIRIKEKVNQIKAGKILSDEELKALGVYFKDYKYGELIYLMEPGAMIVPSFMSRKPLCGMHGYHPDDPDSLAVYFNNKASLGNPESITDIFNF